MEDFYNELIPKEKLLRVNSEIDVGGKGLKTLTKIKKG